MNCKYHFPGTDCPNMQSVKNGRKTFTVCIISTCPRLAAQGKMLKVAITKKQPHNIPITTSTLSSRIQETQRKMTKEYWKHPSVLTPLWRELFRLCHSLQRAQDQINFSS